jgi:polysaccharide biosynthesis transport protein
MPGLTEDSRQVRLRNVMRESIGSDYSKYLKVLRRHRLAAMLAFGTVLGLTIVYVLVKKPVYRISGQLRYEQLDQTSTLVGAESLSKQQTANSGWDDAERMLATEIRTILSEPVLTKTLETIKQRFPADFANEELDNIEDLKSNLTVKNAPDTNLIEVAYDSTDSKFAVQLVNALMANYLGRNLQTSRANSIAVRKFIISQLPEVRNNVYLKDMALRQFKERYGLTDLEVATKSNAENLSRLEEEIDTTQTQLTDVSSQIDNIQQRLGVGANTALAMSSVSQSTAVKEALTDLQGLERQLGQARSQYELEHPAVLSLQSKVSEARKLLGGKVAEALPSKSAKLNRFELGPTQQELMDTLIKNEVTRKSLTDRLSTISQQRSNYMRQTKVLPSLEQRIRELERDLKAAESTFQAMLKSLQEAQVTENQTIGNARIIESAQIPEDPIAPNKTAVIAAGALAGILLALALVYLLEVSDTRIHRVEEVREIFDYVLLGTIPKFTPSDDIAKKYKQLPVLDNPRSMQSEAYQMVVANLKFLSSDQPIKVITISSAIPLEGKSITSANLALAMAQMGQRVLLVDCDFRRPMQHHIWQLTNATGLSNVLVGQIPKGVGVQHSVINGLDVITSGVLPPNPLGLVDSQHMIDLVHQWTTEYDFILIDSPPIRIAADAVILSKISNGLVMVARPDILDKSSAIITKDNLAQSGVNILGLIINGVTADNEPYSYNYFQHYYAKNSHFSDDSETHAVKNSKESSSIKQ